jgi:hypothetical protein
MVFGHVGQKKSRTVGQKKSRPRKVTLKRALREAKGAGLSVSGATYEDGKVSLTFGETAKAAGDELDEWMAGRHANKT